MSNIVAETAVRIRANAQGFREEAQQQVNAAVRGVRAEVPVAAGITGQGAAAAAAQNQILQRARQVAQETSQIAVRSANETQKQVGLGLLQSLRVQAGEAADNIVGELQGRIDDLNLKSLAAGFRGDELGAAQLELESAIAQMQQSGLVARDAALSEVGQVRDTLLAAADGFVRAEQKLQSQLNESRRTGQVPGAAQQPGLGSPIARGAGARTSGIGGLIAVGARLGAIGVAANTAFIALDKIKTSLRTTGQEAFTTEGRFKNLSASLISADIFGALKAVTNQPSSLEELGFDAREAASHLDELRERANKLSQESGTELKRFGTIGRIAGGGLNALQSATRGSADEARRLFEEAKLAAAGVLELDAATRQAITSTLGLRDAQGNLIVAFGPGQQFGLAAGRPASQFSAQSGVAPAANVPSGTLAQEQAVAAAQRSGNLQELLRLANEDLTRKINRVNIVQAGHKTLYAQRVREEIAARNTLDSVKDQIRAQNEAAKATAKAAADQAQSDAQAARDRARQARELALANAEAAAATTARKSDDVKAINATIDYFRAIKDASKGLEREQAQASLIAARGRLQAVLKGTDQPDFREAQLQNQLATAQLNRLDTNPILQAQIRLFTALRNQATGIERIQAEAKLIGAKAALNQNRQALADLKLDNARARAAITDGIGDDRAVILKQIARARAIVKNSKGLAKAQADAKLIQFQGDLARLDKTDAAGGGTTAFDLLTQAAQRFTQSAGNLINKDQPFAGPTGFTADLAQFLHRGSPAAAARDRVQKVVIEDDGLTKAILLNTEAINRSTGHLGKEAPDRKSTGRSSGALERNDRRWQEAGRSRAEVEAAG